MSQQRTVDFDGLMRHLTVIGLAGITAWRTVSAAGLALGVFRISPPATFRPPGGTDPRVRAPQLLGDAGMALAPPPPGERFGFSSPIREHPRASELDTAPMVGGGIEEPRR
jgi:hypothetical protein